MRYCNRKPLNLWGKKTTTTWAVALKAVRIHPVKHWASTTCSFPCELRTTSILHNQVVKDLVAPVRSGNSAPRHSRTLLHEDKDWHMWRLRGFFNLVLCVSRNSKTFDPWRPQQIRLLLQGASLQSSFFPFPKNQVTDTYRKKRGENLLEFRKWTAQTILPMGRGDKSKNKLTISVSSMLVNRVQSTYFWYYILTAGNRLQ